MLLSIHNNIRCTGLDEFDVGVPIQFGIDCPIMDLNPCHDCIVCLLNIDAVMDQCLKILGIQTAPALDTI